MNLGGWGAQEELEWEKGYIFSAQVWSSEENFKSYKLCRNISWFDPCYETFESCREKLKVVYRNTQVIIMCLYVLYMNQNYEQIHI